MKKSTIIAAVLLAALVAVYFATHENPQTKLEAPYEIPAVENLARIEIERPKGETKLIVLEKSGESWMLSKPVEAPLDDKIGKQLDETFAERILTDDIKIPNDKAALYELDEAAVNVALFAEGKSEPAVKFEVGKEMTVEGTRARRSFMQTADGEIYRMRTSLEFLRKPLKDLRDKEILALDRNAIDTVRIRRESGEILVTKAGEKKEWTIKEPAEIPVEASAINGLVGALAGLKATGFADDKKPADVGLDNPTSVMVAPEGKPIELQVSENEGTYYVKMKDGEFIYEIAPNAGERLDATVNSLRDRVPKKFVKDAIKTIEFAGEDRVRITKPSKPDSKWQMNRPSNKELADAKANTYVNAAAVLRVKEFVDVAPEDAGLTNPEDRVVITHVDGRDTLLLGGKVGETEDRYAKWQDLDLVFVLAGSTASRLMPRASDFDG